MAPSYRNQSIDLYCICSDWFSHHGNINLKWVNPFHATGIFPYPLKILEKLLVVTFSGSIERDQWLNMG